MAQEISGNVDQSLLQLLREIYRNPHRKQLHQVPFHPHSVQKTKKIEQIQNNEFTLNKVDTVYLLREDCDQHLTKTVKWLDEYLDILRRKLKIINNYNLQLQQSKKEEEQERHAAEMKSAPQL